MRILHELPPKAGAIVTERLKGEEALACVPFDIGARGKFVHGWTVLTASRLLTMEDGEEPPKSAAGEGAVGEAARREPALDEAALDEAARRETAIREPAICETAVKEGADYKSVVLVGNGRLEAIVRGEATVLARYSMRFVPEYAVIARALNQLQKGETPSLSIAEEERTCPRCGRRLAEGTRVCPACVNRLAVLKRLLGMTRPYRFFLLLALALFWAITGLNLGVPRLNRLLIDSYLIPMRKELAPILLLVASFGAFNLLSALLSVVRGRTVARIGTGLSRDLRTLVYTKIQALSLGYLSKHKTGDLINRVNDDTSRVQGFVQNAAIHGVNEAFIFIAISIVLFLRDWKLALLIILPTPILLVCVRLLWSFIHHIYRKQWKVWDRANSLLQDILSGIRVVKAFGKEDWEVGRFRAASMDLRTITTSNERIWSTLIPLFGLIVGIGNYLVLAYGGHLILAASMEVGELVQFSAYAGMLYEPLHWLSAIPRMYVEAMTSAERIFEVVDEEPDVKERGRTRPHRVEGRVAFTAVRFGYKPHEPVLQDISLEVAPGEMIGLVGHSGAGKSTLINLLLRLYDVTEGELRIDDIDIRDIGLRDLRSQIGVVLQETFLFSGTILDNIRYSKPGAGAEEVIRAAKTAHAHDFICNFPDGYDTRVGERGLTLAGGERQRIAIARAILHDPRILILDEATSSVDTDTEQKIQDALSRLTRDRTTFAIAHRLSTLRNATRLVVLDHGKIAEMGTHAELLAKKGTYYELVMTQLRMSSVKGVSG